MTGLEGLKLWVPELWERREEWHEVYAAADEVERPLIKTLGRLSEVLHELEGRAASPLNLAWLSLWSKVFHCCDGARGAYQRQSVYTARILRRVMFETSLHLGTIAQPLMEAAGIRMTRRRTGALALDAGLARRRVRNRLHAYAAWCIRGDLEYWRCYRDERNLEGVYDPGPRQDFLELAGENRDFWEDWLGPVEEETPEEARAELEKARRGIVARIERLEGWLRHPELRGWNQEIDRLRKASDRPPTFFQLFDEDEYSVGRRLSALGIRFAYLNWKRGSQVMHGDTLEQSVKIVGPMVMPLLGPQKDVTDELSGIGGWAQWSSVMLYMVRPSKVGAS